MSEDRYVAADHATAYADSHGWGVHDACDHCSGAIEVLLGVIARGSTTHGELHKAIVALRKQLEANGVEPLWWAKTEHASFIGEFLPGPVMFVAVPSGGYVYRIDAARASRLQVHPGQEMLAV